MEEIRAREVMVPRPDVVAVPDGMPLGELFSVTAQGGHTRYPVHEDDSLDRIVGAVHIRDVMSTVAAEGLEAPITARELARDVLLVPENRPIDEILKDLQKQEIQMAIVIDEWGSFEGLITIEDIIEELVGEIRDEFDEEEEPAIRERPDGSWLVDGMLAAEELKERLGLGELPREEQADYQTVGGMIDGHPGTRPEHRGPLRVGGAFLRGRGHGRPPRRQGAGHAHPQRLRCRGHPGGLVLPKRRTCLHPLGQRPRVHRLSHQTVAESLRCRNSLHRSRLSLAERLLGDIHKPL